jgi:antitoxin component HigA of HigAB toxin-antitoxin module
MDSGTRLIADKNELGMAQAEIGHLLEIGERTTAEDNRLGVLATLMRYYEDRHWALEMPDPIFAIQSRMGDLELQQTDMLEEFGNKTTAFQDDEPQAVSNTAGYSSAGCQVDAADCCPDTGIRARPGY